MLQLERVHRAPRQELSRRTPEPSSILFISQFKAECLHAAHCSTEKTIAISAASTEQALQY